MLISSDFDFHWRVAVRTDRLLVLEAVEAEPFIVLLADKVLNLDEVDFTAEFDHLMSFAFRVLGMLDLAWVAEEHRVAGQTLELRSVLRIDHIRRA